ncbi:MAG: SpoIIE family protein phosphatase [Bacteroidota bacterium]|nr:SpoIIE family protein phosphatase [Bacteroidota bacterium]
MRKVLIIFFCLLMGRAIAQQSVADSLEAVLPSLNGEKKINTLNDLADYYHRNDETKSDKYANEALALSLKLDYKKGIIASYSNLAYSKIQQSAYKESLDFSIKALKIAESIKDKHLTAEAYTNIANAYLNMFNFELADKNYLYAAKFYGELGDSLNVAIIYTNLAVSFDNREMLDSALVYYNKSLPIYLKMKNNARYLGLWYTNVGDLFRKQKKYPEALDYQIKAEPLLIEAQDNFTLMVLYSGIPYTYSKLGQHQKALEYANKSVALGLQLGSKRELSYSFMTLADVYAGKNDLKNEIKYLRRHIELSDSVFTEETGDAITEMQSKYESEKKEKEIELLNKDKQLQSIEIERHETSRYFYIGIVSLALLLIIVLAFAFKNKNKANHLLRNQKSEIQHQKLVVDIKNKEITDSINYAKRLQQAILATREEINSYLPDNFLYYKPKDIVAGDFYFFETIDTHIFYAAADCTGHGVPGAMVSVVCANALSRCVKEFKLSDPGRILDKTRELVLETFSKNNNEVKDGMDISLIAIEKETKKVFWSGANNPLWYITENELKEIKPNKQPIGKTDQPVPFTTHEINHIQGTVFYLFTDGYADQFGGEKGKKFKYKQLQATLVDNKHLPLKEQADILKQKFVQWKGNLEQVDDVCVIGFRL